MDTDSRRTATPLGAPFEELNELASDACDYNSGQHSARIIRAALANLLTQEEAQILVSGQRDWTPGIWDKLRRIAAHA
jgi:hypothetical protein